MNRKVFIVLGLIVIFAVALLAVLLGCSQDPDGVEVFNAFSGLDCIAPTLLSVKSEAGDIVRLEFDEPVRIYGSSLNQYVARADGRFIYVQFPKTILPGKKSVLSGRVKDYSGNTTGFSVSVWGFNPRLPGIIINEFTTKGTSRSPDRTELRVLEDGNLEGLTLYCGIPGDCDASVMLGDMEVARDDLIVIWWTESLPVDVSVKVGRVINVCSGLSSDPSSNNGTFVLCDNPSLGAEVLDAVIYSGFSQSHEGYGTRTALERAKWVLAAGAWEGAAVDCNASTATRSVSRFSDARDTDCREDWYVTVTSGSTFGKQNTSDAL